MNQPVMEGLRLNVPAYVKHQRLVAWVAEIAALTEDTVAAAASEFFTPERYTLVWLGPKS